MTITARFVLGVVVAIIGGVILVANGVDIRVLTGVGLLLAGIGLCV